MTYKSMYFSSHDVATAAHTPVSEKDLQWRQQSYLPGHSSAHQPQQAHSCLG